MNNYIEKFIEILGEPYSLENLAYYIEFVMKNTVIKEESSEYCEDHHIIPTSIFKNDEVYTLTYINHVEAHVLLAKAYPISKFLRPLNFMLSRNEKESIEYRKLLSYSIKDNWKKFKNTNQYIIWKEKRRSACKNHMINGHAKIMAEKGNTPELKKKKSEAMKLYWTEERKKEKSLSMIEYNEVNGTERYSKALRKRYSDMSEQKFTEFVDKMNKVNKNPEKRKKAGNKIKEKWKDPVFIEKMKNRKQGSSESRSSKMKELWADPVWKENMLEKRRNKNNETNKN